MKIFTEIQPLNMKTSVALGYFDGMHRGHREIMRQTVAYAKKMHLRATVFTFNFSNQRPGDKGNADLFDRSVIYEKIERMGIDLIVEVPFEEIRQMSGRGFIANILGHKCLNAAVINCGEDFRFGKGRDSDVSVMRLLARSHGIQVNVVPFVMDNGIISTTRVKRLVEAGDVLAASTLLGFNYLYQADTITKQTGIGIDYTTVSQHLDDHLLLPKFGVYTSRISFGDNSLDSVTYIGTRPTKLNSDEVYADTHIFCFEGSIPDNTLLRVELLRMIRAEEQFDSLSILKDTIRSDIERAKGILPHD
ncbi:MAG: hypothetical protein FWG21_00385 [Oscillospiraceae bacterium]|nr:hypothetical protein [Oscillospiraceae bacterium]